jgi:hypothetical protein
MNFKLAIFFAQNRMFDIYQAIFAPAIKRSLMWLYNHELIKGATVLRLFDRFQLWNA